MAAAVKLSRDLLSPAVILLVVFGLMIGLSGGSARADSAGQLVARIGAIVAGAFALVLLDSDGLRRVRVPLAFVASLALLVILQLIPVPPAIWARSPVIDLYQPGWDALGQAEHWRPIALVPDLALNTLMSLLPPLAAILVFAALPRERSIVVLWLLAGLAVISGVLGLVQLSAGGRESLYLYRISNFGTSTGLFANRNHQAALLAMLPPMIAAILGASRQRLSGDQQSAWTTLALSLSVLPFVVATGSRAGLVLGLVGAVGTWFLVSGGQNSSAPRRGQQLRKRRISSLSVAWALGLVGVASLVLLSRASVIQRLFSEDVSQEIRVSLLVPLLSLGWAHQPLGTGFGSFVDVFKAAEPDWNLSTSYLNHAHNDLLELFIEAGIPGLLALFVFLLWWGARALDLWRNPVAGSQSRMSGRAATIVTLIALVASLSDYPLRTPLMAVIFTFACCLMLPNSRKARAGEPGEPAVDGPLG